MKCQICGEETYIIHIDAKHEKVCQDCFRGLTPMHIEKIKVMLRDDEDLRLKPYRCSAGKLTIAIGRNLTDKGITKEEAYYLLNNDIKECHADLYKIFGPILFNSFSESRQHAFINMRFQLGPDGFRGFKKMISAAKKEDWQEVIAQAKNSKWCKQDTPNRARRVIAMLEKG